MLTIPAHAYPHRTPLELFALARRGLAEAIDASTDEARFASAHLAALRAAAAVLAIRARPAPVSRRKPTSVWELLALVAPELSGWSLRFAGSARRRSCAEAGVPGSITPEEAAALVGDVERFVSVVAETMSLPCAPNVMPLAA